MQPYDPDVLLALAASEYAHAELILFDLPTSGLQGFWRGIGPLEVDGVTYVGAGSLIELQQIDYGVELTASPISIKLRAVPETPLTPDILATIDDENYKGATVYISLAYFDRTTGAIITTMRQWRGYVDYVEHTGTVGDDYALVGRLEPRSLDHSRANTRVRGDADQKLLDAADVFFEHAATTPTETLPYGRSTTQPDANNSPSRQGVTGR